MAPRAGSAGEPSVHTGHGKDFHNRGCIQYTFGVAPHEHGGGTDARFVSMREFSMVRKHAVRMHEYAVESSARQHARVKDECERHECFESASRVQV